jgi:hypothetical protein
MFLSWLRTRTRHRMREARRTSKAAGRNATFRPQLESLEDRCLPSTLTVLNTNDSGPGSLRATIAAAQSGDTIVFDPGLAYQTIQLTSGELVLDKSLDITGPVNGQLTVDALFASRIFDITSTSATVTVAGLIIAEGHAIGAGGGLVNYGTLTVNGCVFRDNSVSGGSGHRVAGGAIANFGILTVTDTAFSHNSAATNGRFTEEGGAIANFGALFVSSSSFSNNWVLTSNIEGDGGALANWGTAVVADSQFAANFGLGFPVYGGAIENRGTLTVEATSFQHNGSIFNAGNGGYYPASIAEGGAIDNRAALAVTNSSFYQNEAISGGAIANRGTALVSATDYEGNGAYKEGGAIQNWGQMTVSASTFTANLAGVIPSQGITSGFQGIGGAISNRGSLALETSTVFNNGAASTTSAPSEGAGIANFGAVTITDSTVTDNGAELGGDLYNAGIVHVFDSIIGDRYDV